MQKLRSITFIFLAIVMLLGFIPTSYTVEASGGEYEIYPNPQSIEYDGKEFILRDKFNVIYEKDIDQATKNRLKEVADTKNIEIHNNSKVSQSREYTNILVGIHNSKGYVDNYVKDDRYSQDLFTKTDSYYLSVKNGNIVVLGRNTDAAFYGLTTLLNVFKQIDSKTIKNFEVQDFADIKSRGFIEGYYGDPWSTQDRINLMKWSGYYKLNSYFYAPKDDPKHNRNWRELYTKEEIENKIKPLAKAGNESKCRFVFALHPFMNSPIRFTTENYQNDLNILKAKFKQVIDAGVRQISVLADDARNFNNTGNLGGNNYKRLLQDLTVWLKELQKIYPDLKLTLPFVTVEYMGWGESYYRDFPENVQIVMTGGRVWGEVSQSFTNGFTSRVGRGPYMWINWPCTDNSKKHLIMAGYDDFLQVGVRPDNIEGIVLNPMQQSEPSKVAIFGNAVYSWKIWSTKAEADKAWNDSFSYVTDNSPIETAGSRALKELSKHMINQNMDYRVRALQESIELKNLLNSFKSKLSNKTVSKQDIQAVLREFEVLKDAAKTYRNQPGNKDILDQIIYWINSWDDTTEAAIKYLKAVESIIDGNTDNILKYNAEAKAAFTRSKTHGFHYVDHTEYAEVGVQHIVPFIKTLENYVSKNIETLLNPDKVVSTFITSRTDTPVGNLDGVFDGDDNTMISFRNPVYVNANDYIGVLYNKTIDIENARFLLGRGKNHFKHAKLQYTLDGNTWSNVELRGVNNSFRTDVSNSAPAMEVNLSKENLPENFRARGLRLIAVENNGIDSYLDVHEIQINKKPVNIEDQPLTYNILKTSRWVVTQNTNENSLFDGNPSTFVWYDPDGSANSTRDTALVNDFLAIDLGKSVNIEQINLIVGNSGADKLIKYAVETSLDNQNWTAIEGYENYTGKSSGTDNLTIRKDGLTARYIRVRNLENRNFWLKFSEFTVVEKNNNSGTDKYLYKNIDTEILSNNEDGIASLTNGNIILQPSKYIGLDLKNIKDIKNISEISLPDGVKIKYSKNAIEWKNYNNEEVDARYIILENTSSSDKEINLNNFNVKYYHIGKTKVESDFAMNQNSDDMRSANTVKNVFDGNLSTFGMINGPQEQGKYITFDLGRVIDIHSLRYYVNETQLNFLRDADFEVSVDGQSFERVMHVGQRESNTHNDKTAKSMQDITLLHDSSNPGYMYKEQNNINKKARFIRIKPTSTYSHRWVAINEIQINNGEYLSLESNKDIISKAVEVPNKIPSNMLDKDYSTSYKSSEKNSSFIYYPSEPKGYRTLRIIQDSSISNAIVQAEVYTSLETLETKVIDLGRLSQTISEFNIPENLTFKNIKVSWDEEIPEITEISLYKNVDDKSSKLNDLRELIKRAEDLKVKNSDNWTKDSKNNLVNNLEIAKEILNNENASLSMISSVKAKLNMAINGVIDKYKGEELSELVNNAIDNEKHYYTSDSFNNYINKINLSKSKLEDIENLSNEEANALISEIKDLKEKLVYSTLWREKAELTLEDILSEEERKLYTEESLKEYDKFIKAIQDKINQDKSGERISPKVFENLINEFNNYDKLVEKNSKTKVDKKALADLVKQAETINLDKYTDESTKNLLESLEDAKEVLNSDKSTQLEVKIAKENLESAIEQLKKINTETVKQKIQRIKRYSQGVTIRDAKGQKLSVLRRGRYIEGIYNPNNPNWIKIKYKGKDAFVYGKYLQKTPVRHDGYSVGANYRTEPNGELLGSISYGVKLIGRINGNNPDWVDLYLRGKKVSIYKDLVVKASRKIYTTKVVSNFRIKPNGKILGTIQRGIKLRGVVYGEIGKWLNINYRGKTGYIYMK